MNLSEAEKINIRLRTRYTIKHYNYRTFERFLFEYHKYRHFSFANDVKAKARHVHISDFVFKFSLRFDQSFHPLAAT